MRRKYFAFVLAILCILLGSSCSNSKSSLSSYRDENGNFIVESEGRRSVSPSQLPVDIPYNDNSISIEKVEFYQLYLDYSYTLFVITTLGVRSLTEAQLHWLRESDLAVRIYITSEDNSYDFKSASALGNVHMLDTGELVFVATSSFFDENRYGFENSKITVAVEVTQEETYEYKNSSGKVSNLHKVEEVSYSTMTEDTIADAETIGEPLYSYIAEWLYSKAGTFN